jgi:hypothetical protein
MSRAVFGEFRMEAGGSSAVRPLGEGKDMTGNDRVEQLVKTIDRAITQAEDLGMTHAVRLLMLVRLEVDLSEIANETNRNVGAA